MICNLFYFISNFWDNIFVVLHAWLILTQLTVSRFYILRILKATKLKQISCQNENMDVQVQSYDNNSLMNQLSKRWGKGHQWLWNDCRRADKENFVTWIMVKVKTLNPALNMQHKLRELSVDIWAFYKYALMHYFFSWFTSGDRL